MNVPCFALLCCQHHLPGLFSLQSQSLIDSFFLSHTPSVSLLLASYNSWCHQNTPSGVALKMTASPTSARLKGFSSGQLQAHIPDSPYIPLLITALLPSASEPYSLGLPGKPKHIISISLCHGIVRMWLQLLGCPPLCTGSHTGTQLKDKKRS